MTQLEHRLESLDSELKMLARMKLLGGVGPVAFESAVHRTPQHHEWMQVDWKEASPIDQIVLAPAIWHDSHIGFTARGFPLEFQIIAGVGDETNGQLIASFSPEDSLLPRQAPLIVPCSTTASWIRVEATLLSERGLDEQFNLQLSELMAFSGEENVALKSTVTFSSAGRQGDLRRHKSFLTDGILPYEMDVESPKKSYAFAAFITPDNKPSITIDLKQTYPISRIHIHAQNVGQTAPQAVPNAFGLPHRFIIEGANRKDFVDAKPLYTYQKDNLYDAGPILIGHFPESSHRYVRLTVLKMSQLTHLHQLLSFSEIEVFSRGRNVALSCSAEAQHVRRIIHPTGLTDGQNVYGRILPLRQWVNELARRHDLEKIRPLLRAEIDLRYVRHKELVRTLSWLSALLGAGIVIVFLTDRLVHLNRIRKLRERIAADLHDELGANLHAIGLLGDLAHDAKNSPDELGGLLQNIRELTKRTNQATRDCTNMLQAKDQYTNVAENMQRSGKRLLADLEHDLVIEGEEFLNHLSLRRRIDLFLFYKECLTNIIRHSGATHVDTQLTASRRRIDLTVTDNGRGMNSEHPASLKRRAHFLRGRVDISTPESGGTQISLTLTTRKLGFTGFKAHEH